MQCGTWHGPIQPWSSRWKMDLEFRSGQGSEILDNSPCHAPNRIKGASTTSMLDVMAARQFPAYRLIASAAHATAR